MTVLKCDYDGRIPAAFLARLAFVCRVHRVRVVLVETNRTRHGYHVLVTVTGRVAFARVILMQALLGSDWKRELFNSRRAMAWRDVPVFWRDRANVLYVRHYRSVTPMSNDNQGSLSYGELIPKITPDDTEGKPAALTIRRVRRQNMAPEGRPVEIKIVIEFAERFSGADDDGRRREYIVNSTSYKTLCAKLGQDETKWAGKSIVMAPTNTEYAGTTYEKLHVASPERWDKVVKATAGATSAPAAKTPRKKR